MIWSNDELVGAKDDALIDIKSAMDNLSGIDEYKEIYEALSEIKDSLKEIGEVYEERLNEEWEKEREEEFSEYRRSVL